MADPEAIQQAWTAWDRAPGSEATARRLEAALAEHFPEPHGVTAHRLAVAAARRAGAELAEAVAAALG